MNIPVEKMNVEDMMEINEHDWMAITVVQSSVVICFFFFFFFFSSSSSILFFVFFFNFFSLFPTMAENDRSEDERNIVLPRRRHHLV